MQEDLWLGFAHTHLAGDHHGVEQPGEVRARVLIATPGVGQQRSTESGPAQRPDHLVHGWYRNARREHPLEQARRYDRFAVRAPQPGGQGGLELRYRALAAFKRVHRIGRGIGR